MAIYYENGLWLGLFRDDFREEDLKVEEKQNPTECKYCGLHATWHIHEDTFFACGTIYAGRGDYWNESTGCMEIMQSRKRIQRAVEVLEWARRICVGLCDEDGEDVESEHDGVIYVESTEADRAIEILKGETDGEAE